VASRRKHKAAPRAECESQEAAAPWQRTQRRKNRHRMRMILASTLSSDRNPLHADFYADAVTQARVPVIENVQLARDTYRIRFECPEIARRIVPGQFIMLRLAELNDPLLGRPLALYDTVLDAAGRPFAIDVVY